jgi:outer membrane protein OmpA-like peptidoglycan-associated protein
VNVPADVPAEDFWSFTLYDNQTRSMLQTDAQFPAIGSSDQGVVQNEDGSYDIYFAPEAPEGKESNWVQTVPGKGWNTILRLYGPLEPWFDQTWRPGEIELINFARSEAAPNEETAKEISLRITIDGRVAIYGVQFETGSTAILPFSEGTLEAIAGMMADLPDLNVAVVGHTDNVGGYESNLDLSKRRADAVVAELVNTFGIDGTRLFAAGASFLAPMTSNETEEGRTLNRRVELVRAP